MPGTISGGRHVSKSSFGAELRRFRDAAGLSQAELGEAMGVAQTRISSWERGGNKPNENNVLDIARALGVSSGHLLEASQWSGAIVVGSERRKRLQRLLEEDWLILDPLIDALSKADSQKRTVLAQKVREITGTSTG